MFGFEVVLSGMAVFRVVATPHVPAGPAQPKVNPRVSGGQALLTAVAARYHGPHRIEMRALLAGFSHIPLRSRRDLRIALPHRELRGGTML